jgi:transposase
MVAGRLDDATVILGVLADRKKSTVQVFLSGMPRKLRKTIKAVCSDRYDGFMHAAPEVFGKRVKIVMDRFQVAKLSRKGLETLRKQELHRLQQEISEEAYKQLQGVMWALRKREDNLTDEDKDRLACLFVHTPLLKVAYELCNAVTGIFDKRRGKRRATSQLTDWIERGRDSTLHCFNTFLTTLEKWRDEIANYFLDRQTSGFVEGLNNKIKVIKRRCYGILNVKHLFQRIHLDLSGYAFFAWKTR